MSKKRIEFMLIGVTVLALCAGLAAGLLASRLPGSGASSSSSSSSTSPSSGVPADPRTPLVEELQLSPAQRDQMREIWEGVRGKVHQAFADAQRLQKDRDDALVALLSDEQKARFETISKKYASQFDELTHKRDATFQEAVERTKQLLNEEQRAKYEQILKRQVGPAGSAPTTTTPASPEKP
jgi:Spy/CpxP family protein refolding chaperone